ncbi:MAG: lysophospholipid acyltransferase family protein [Roseitalea sp.]|nr:lysophospholipid acyltransferase family protein [Roseitalea sp.]MBO6720979.1 lysophospholipid acyltransferase family protein [Roseitalea sp.]MBO6743284.1 lysophospholipid acyltransferase family protein [Roseitalea sp.]
MEIQSATSTFAGVINGRRGDIAAQTDPHIVDQLIAERGQTLVKSPLWPVLRPALYKILHYREAVRMADAVADMSGLDCFGHISDLLKLDVRVTGSEHLPASGSFILVSNHPTGIADGVAVHDMLKGIRPDFMFFANRDAIRVNQRLAEIIIPVEWRADQKSHAKSRETLVRTNRAFKDDRAIVLFPSGRIAYWSHGGLKERPWQATAIHMAKRYNVPIVPMHLEARNSWLFYLLAHRNPELRDMTVFHELLNKTGKTFSMTLGAPIAPDALDGDVQDLTVKLQDHCEHALKADKDAVFHC